jgi:hypothetical protein
MFTISYDVYSNIQRKPIKEQSGQHAESLNVKASVYKMPNEMERILNRSNLLIWKEAVVGVRYSKALTQHSPEDTG